MKTLGQLAAEGAKDVDWRWHGYLASEAITLLGSKPKVGKSTLLFGLLGALERGALFVGLPTQRTRVLYVSEETGSQLQRKADKFGLDDDWHYVLPRAATFGHEWEKVAEAAGQLALERDCGVVVFDTFGGLARLGGDDENKAGRMMTALEPLHGIKVLGLAVLLSAHQRKSEGDHGDTIRGSNALPGDVDIIATLSRPGGDTHTSARILNAEGRYDETPERRHIALDQATNTYTTTGPPVVVKKQQREEEDVAILARLGTATATQFAKVAGCTDKTAKRRLDALVTGGRATCSGDGTRQSRTSYALTGGRSGQGSGQDALFGDGDPDRHHPPLRGCVGIPVGNLAQTGGSSSHRSTDVSLRGSGRVGQDLDAEDSQHAAPSSGERDYPSATGCTHPEAHRTSWEGDTCVRCSSEAQRLGRVVTPPGAADPLDGADESAFLAAMHAMAAEDHR